MQTSNISPNIEALSFIEDMRAQPWFEPANQVRLTGSKVQVATLNRLQLLKLCDWLTNRLVGQSVSPFVETGWSRETPAIWRIKYNIYLDFSARKQYIPYEANDPLELDWVCMADTEIADYCLFETVKKSNIGIYQKFSSYSWTRYGAELSFVSPPDLAQLKACLLGFDVEVKKATGQVAIRYPRLLPDMPGRYLVD